MPDYKYDIFISYNAETESALAEVFFLFLQMFPHLNPRKLEEAKKVGRHQNKVFLDQHILKKGQTWKDSYKALKRSVLVLLLVSNEAVERFKRSNIAVDPLLLEWETALLAAEEEKCAVLPVFIAAGDGKGFDFGAVDKALSSDLYPLDRAPSDDALQPYLSASSMLRKLVKTQGIFLANHLQIKSLLPRISSKVSDFIDSGVQALEKAKASFKLLNVNFEFTDSWCHLNDKTESEVLRFWNEMVPFNSYWTEVVMQDIDITDKLLEGIARGAILAQRRQVSKLVKLEIKECTFEFEASEAIEKFFGALRSGFSLVLRNNYNVTKPRLKLIFDALKLSRRISEFTITDDDLTQMDVFDDLASFVKQTPSLKGLFLDNVDIGVKGFIKIVGATSTSGLRELSIVDAETFNPPTTVIDDLVLRSSLQRLRLGGTVSNSSSALICKTLKQNSVLTSLDLGVSFYRFLLWLIFTRLFPN
ncbi:hypothetical protein BJ742DRAFT_798094 [Cladochytrium replicatum]|nr:hypothetical protein BJ742DRAFT_798094 [Cladochytrium replicatum]